MKKILPWIWLLLPLSLLTGEWHITYKSIPLYPYECVILVLFLVALFSKGWQSFTQIIKQLPLLAKVGFVVLGFALIPAFIISPDHQAALGVLKSWFFFPLLAALSLGIGTDEDKNMVLRGIVLFSVIQTMIGFVLLRHQPEFRLHGLFASANFYAAAAVPACLIALQSMRKSKIIIAAALVLLIGILLSQSLGGLLGLIGGAIFLGLYAENLKVKRFVQIGAVLALLLGGVLAFQRFYGLQGTSLNSRQEIWHVAGVLIREHPITGVGIKGFHRAYEQNVGRIIGLPVEWSVPEPHNLYLGWWLNYGIAGLFGMLCIIVSARHGIRDNLGVAAALFAVLIHGLVDTPFLKLELAVLFWLYIALLMRQKTDEKS